MTTRTTESIVTFRNSFKLSVCVEQPAGDYRLVIDEEEIRDLSFLAYQRTVTMLHTPAISVVGGLHQVFSVSSVELAAALEADARS